MKWFQILNAFNPLLTPHPGETFTEERIDGLFTIQTELRI